MVKFLATGDFHSDMNLLAKISSNVEFKDLDFILITGDISERDDDFKQLLTTFENKKMLFVPGNHEDKKKIDALINDYNVHSIHDEAIELDGITFFGTGYMAIGINSVHEQEVLDDLIQKHKNLERKDNLKVLLKHIPPINTQSGRGSPFFPMIGGSQASQIFIENFKPDLILSGHIHEKSGLVEKIGKSKLVNVAQTYKIFEFDKEKRKIEILN